MAIYLVISENDQNHRIRLTNKPFFMGRSNKCHLTVTDSMVSGKHLAVKINDDNRVVIKDLDTTNGTYLNGNKIQESLLYLEDFIQIGKIKINLDDSDMSANELKLHKRDFERTNVTFVRLGATVEGFDDDEEDEFGVSKQKTLLAKIRRKKESEQTVTVTEQQQKEINEEEQIEKDESEAPPSIESVEIDKKPQKKKRLQNKKPQSKEQDQNGLVGKIKGIFKKRLGLRNPRHFRNIIL